MATYQITSSAGANLGTYPAREALEREGNRVAATDTVRYGVTLYSVELVRPPEGLRLVLIGHGAEQYHGLRLGSEPEYPGEWPDGEGIAWHEHGQLVACPECGHALLWCEAGYVPGWRICLAGHAVQLSGDGRSAERRPKSDRGTLETTRARAGAR